MESGNEAVTEIVRMIRWATDALDKGYLKELIISVNTVSTIKIKFYLSV